MAISCTLGLGGRAKPQCLAQLEARESAFLGQGHLPGGCRVWEGFPLSK